MAVDQAAMLRRMKEIETILIRNQEIDSTLTGYDNLVKEKKKNLRKIDDILKVVGKDVKDITVESRLELKELKDDN